jgi:hypothetical protein
VGSVLDKVRQLIAMTAVDNIEEARSMAHAACKLMREHKVVLSLPPSVSPVEQALHDAFRSTQAPVGAPPKPTGSAWSAHAPPPPEAQKEAEKVRRPARSGSNMHEHRGPMRHAVQVKSKYEAWCKGCGVAIEEGDVVWWRKGLGVSCTECGHGPLEE